MTDRPALPPCASCGRACIPLADYEPRVVCVRCADAIDAVVEAVPVLAQLIAHGGPVAVPESEPRPVSDLFAQIRAEAGPEWRATA